MVSPTEHRTDEEKIIITQRERLLLEIVARMVSRIAPEISYDAEYKPRDMVLRYAQKAIEEFTCLQESTSG